MVVVGSSGNKMFEPFTKYARLPSCSQFTYLIVVRDIFFILEQTNAVHSTFPPKKELPVGLSEWKRLPPRWLVQQTKLTVSVYLAAIVFYTLCKLWNILRTCYRQSYFELHILTRRPLHPSKNNRRQIYEHWGPVQGYILSVDSSTRK